MRTKREKILTQIRKLKDESPYEWQLLVQDIAIDTLYPSQTEKDENMLMVLVIRGLDRYLDKAITKPPMLSGEEARQILS